MSKQVIKLGIGPILYFMILWLGNFKGLSPQGQAVLATTFWMAAWWTMEAVPMAITALLPLILFPLAGVMSLNITGATYGHPIIFLFVGGFMIASAIERWNLHSRVALTIIAKLGTSPKTIVLSFMLATAFLSMWISNTATTIMMLPIGIAIIHQLAGTDKTSLNDPFAKALLLGIAYSASIGGIATLIGTPTNVIFVGVIFEKYGIEVSFAKWMLFATPIALLLLFLCWYYLVNIAFKLSSQSNNNLDGLKAIQSYKQKLGPISYEEKVIVIVFSMVAFCWITRSFLLNPFIPNLSDPIIAMLGTLALFIIPTKHKRNSKHSASTSQDSIENQSPTILDWQTAVKIPWGIILLFGGGLSLAKAFNLSGLAMWIGLKFHLLSVLPLFLLLLVIIALVNFLTEITSNIATVSMILPVLAALSTSIGIDPYMLMIGATCAASCAFMLPIATAPNAIVFGSGCIRIGDMVKAGIGLNIASILLFSIYIYFIMPLIFSHTL